MRVRDPYDLLSRDPIARRDGVRRLIRQLVDRRDDLTLTDLARITDHTQHRFDRMLCKGDRYAVPLADLGPLAETLGTEFLEPFVEVAGYRLVRVEEGPVQSRDLFSSAATLMREAAEDCSAVATAISDGNVTPSEAATIRRELAETRRAISDLEAAVDAAEVQAPGVAHLESFRNRGR